MALTTVMTLFVQKRRCVSASVLR